jgi:CheY-like chemotaxis protein
MMVRVPLAKRYKSGQVVPRDGIYRVSHQKHRLPHESVLTRGMRFPICKVCRDKVRFEPVTAVEPADGMNGRTRGSLLVVDPEPSITFTLKQILEQEGYRVWAATDYSAAKRMLGENEYDAVLADIHLENSDAMGLLHRAKNHRRPPVVMLSTDEPDVASLRAMLKMKVNYLFFKPIDLSELRSTLACMIPRRASAMAVAELAQKPLLTTFSE